MTLDDICNNGFKSFTQMYPQNNDNWILSYATKDIRF